MTPPITPQDERRSVLDSMQMGSLQDLPSLDGITRLAGYAFNAPVAFVSILGDVKQRFISRIGLPMAETCIRSSICAHAITANEVFVVQDLELDPRFKENPLVTGDLRLRFYAGAPLIAKNGVAIGALCIMATEPRNFLENDREQLSSMAQLVMGQLELRNMSGRLDPVSGIASRHQLHQDYAGILTRKGKGTLYAVAVDVLDVPHANQVGQVLGLRPLEVLIRRAGVRLRTALDGIAVVYHVGVTRFAFIVEMNSLAQVDNLIAELKVRMLRPLVAAGIPLYPRFQVGLLILDDAENDSHELLRKLLVSLNCAFESRQETCWYSEERDRAIHRAYRLASEAERGIINNEFFLEYQPRFDAKTLRPVSAEALIRWKHPEFGVISPAEFIPVFEKTALMGIVTNWVLESAFDQIAAWQLDGLHIPVSINLSSSYLEMQTAWDVIQAKLAARDIQFAMVEFEITEGEWLNPESAAVDHIREMASAGIKISIDDFGSGYSNFNYLSDLPIHTIKLDKSLIDGVDDDDRSRAKVSAIHHLSSELGYLTVAEGVERKEQLEALVQLGLDQIQGYLLAKPSGPSQIATTFATWT